MDGLANGAETMACPHCGKEMRRGMIRCRECGKAITEADGDFVLTGHVLKSSEDRKCPRCGCILEPGVTDCPSCTSAMLDELMGPGPEVASHDPQPAARRPALPPEPHLRQPPPATTPTEEDDPFAEPARPMETALRPRPTDAAPAARKGTAPAKAAGPGPAKPKPAAPSKPTAPRVSEPVEEGSDPATTNTPVETTAACTALLASLSTADVVLRCEIAAALGKLGDKAALGPLDRFMGDPDIRVRRAVAAALVQLGHPKGETLLDIAERKPAAVALAKPPPKPKKSGGSSMNVDPGMLLKIGGGILAVAVIVGGIWMWMNSKPSPRPKKKSGKPTATKSTPAPKSKRGGGVKLD